MKRKSIILLIISAILASIMIAPLADARVHVRGYTKKNGTYVAPHYRSNPKHH